MITTGREIDLFWGRRVTGATVMFLANKYFTLLYALVAVFAFALVHSPNVRPLLNLFAHTNDRAEVLRLFL